MKKYYKIEYTGIALIEAESIEEAKEIFLGDGDYIIASNTVDAVSETEYTDWREALRGEGDEE